MQYIIKILTLLGCMFSLTVKAQDSLWVKKRGGKPYLVHTARMGEDIFLLSKKYSVPPAVLADANNLNYQSGLDEGKKIWVPIDNYNFIRVEGVIKSKPIFYKVGSDDELDDIGRMVNVSQSSIQRWNTMSTPDIQSGQVVQVGWIAYDSQQVPFAGNPKKIISTPTSPAPQQPSPPVRKPTPQVATTASVATPIKKDTIKPSVLAVDSPAVAEEDNAYEDLYDQQIMGQPSNSESGAAVFYTLKMKTAPGVYYGFHNTAEKGTIIKVTNPSNGNVVYVKVLGAIPKLNDYNNAIIAISANAAKALLAKEKRMFCKIEYR